MVTDEAGAGDAAKREQAIRTVTSKALVFGESSAARIAPETFDDPVMHTYFLFYVYGALGSLGEDLRLADGPLSFAEKQAAMAEALAAFGTATREQIIGTVKLLARSADEAAIRIKNVGMQAAIDWDWGDNADASSAFADLMEDPGNFPRDVDQALQDLPGDAARKTQ